MSVVSAMTDVRPYLTVEEAADLLNVSPRSVHERTRLRALPLRKMPGQRKILIPREELLAWIDGAELEVVEKDNGTVVVRPAFPASTEAVI